MSTERSRRRADKRSKAVASGRKKYHSEIIDPLAGTDQADASSWRGIVLPPRYRRVSNKLIVADGCKINTKGLMAHLFFWDRVAIPKPGKQDHVPLDQSFLAHLHRIVVSTSRRDRLHLSEDAAISGFEDLRFHGRRTVRRAEILKTEDLEWENQIQTFMGLEERDPGRWSICDLGRSTSERSRGRSLLVRLYNAIPVPDADVPLLDVAEFKAKHYAELIDLRRALNEIYGRIERSPASGMAFDREFADLRDTILALSDALERAKMTRSFVTIDAKLKWEFDLRPAMAAAFVAQISDLNVALVAAIAGIANLIPKIETTASHDGLSLRGGEALAYAHLISKEFFPTNYGAWNGGSPSAG